VTTGTSCARSATATPPADFNGARWSLLKAPENLTNEQAATLRRLRRAGGEVWRAYTLKEALRAIFAPGLTLADVTILIDRFISKATRSRLTRSCGSPRRSAATATGSCAPSGSGPTRAAPKRSTTKSGSSPAAPTAFTPPSRARPRDAHLRADHPPTPVGGCRNTCFLKRRTAKPAARFPSPECGRGDRPVHHTDPRTWRYLNFFEHEAYLHARVPRVKCPDHGVKQVQLPWARGRSDFTLLFEALVKEMPVRAIGGLVGEHDTKIWRIVHHYVDLAVDAQDLSGTEQLGIDDTSFRRVQDYATVFADLGASERRAVFIAEGRDQQTVEQFASFLIAHGGEVGQINEVCQDMSQTYAVGVRDHLRKARVPFDRYHVKQKLSEAVDTVRKADAKRHKELLKGTKYLWLKRTDNLTIK
jgi:Transposase/zinc-finger of transposase IS204/IS1001/IS1096/IS1165/Helix-turn-helix domain of transposase family ISL3